MKENNGFWPAIKFLQTLQALDIDLGITKIKDVKEYVNRNYRDGCNNPQEAHESPEETIKRARTLLE